MPKVKTGPNAWSDGAVKLLQKADKYLSKPDGKANSLLTDQRVRNAKKAGIKTELGFNREPSEYNQLEKAIASIKKKKK